MSLFMQWINADRRAATVRVVAVLFVLAAVVQLSAHLMQYNAVKSYEQGTDSRVDYITSADHFVSSASVAVSLLGLLCVVVYSMWLHASYKLISGTFIPMRKFTPSAAAVSMFIPFLNLYQPYQALRELWQITNVIEQYKDQASATFAWWTTKTPRSLLLWWTSYIAFIVCITLANKLESYISDYQTYYSYSNLAMIADVFGVLAGLLLFRVVKIVGNGQAAMIQSLTENQSNSNEGSMSTNSGANLPA